MADATGNQASKDYGVGIPPANQTYYLKGMEHIDWGMKNRLARIFNPKSGNTVMLAFDHGYIMGSPSGLERLDLVIPPLVPEVDVLMATRGGIRTCILPTYNKAVCLRCTTDASVLHEDMSLGVVGVDVEDAVRMNASAMAIQCFVGSENEVGSLKNLCDAVNAGNRVGMPVLGVVAVGKEMARTAKYFLLATRMLAELGAHIIKTYYCEDFEKITAACPVPIVIAGGKKLPEKEALEMAWGAIDQGARGVDMGRNILQAEDPVAMANAIRHVVHEKYSAQQAFELYESIRKR